MDNKIKSIEERVAAIENTNSVTTQLLEKVFKIEQSNDLILRMVVNFDRFEEKQTEKNDREA